MFTGFNNMKVINDLNECYLLKRVPETRQIRLKKVGVEDPKTVHTDDTFEKFGCR